jgi:hypothetical protein
MPTHRLAPFAVALALALEPAATVAAGEDARPIQDNSFLLEEAYNQEPGVIQHISAFARNRSGDWAYSFTEEWPAPGQRHQVSVTVQAVHGGDGGDRGTGFGDVLLNYRLQALGSGETPIAAAPRVSLVVPTGAWPRGFGDGGVGVQVALPVSVMLGPWFVAHSNVGTTFVPFARSPTGNGQRVGVQLGEGLVWLAHPRLNLLVEALYAVSELYVPGGTERVEAFLVSPGLRAAIDFPFGLQVVPGVAVPIGFGPSVGSRSVFLYLSFEHPITRGAAQ